VLVTRTGTVFPKVVAGMQKAKNSTTEAFFTIGTDLWFVREVR
jgi:hypothetical protein